MSEASYAIGKRALGICDRCGFRFRLNTLKHESVRGVQRSMLVCSSCWDGDHPQNFQGVKPIFDPQALRDPRRDKPEAPVPPYVPPKIGFPP